MGFARIDWNSGSVFVCVKRDGMTTNQDNNNSIGITVHGLSVLDTILSLPCVFYRQIYTSLDARCRILLQDSSARRRCWIVLKIV